MADPLISIVCSAYQAYADDDRAKIEALISNDFHFASPLDNRIDRQIYFDRCWKNHATITGFSFINLVRDSDRVFVTYEGRRSDGKAFRNTEIVTVRNGKITDVEVYFGWSIPHDAPPGGFLGT
jgi:ketosteroid isomerase-like protein